MAGFAAAIISQPADTLLSKINKTKGLPGESVSSRLIKMAGELGPRGLFTGMGARYAFEYLNPNLHSIPLQSCHDRYPHCRSVRHLLRYQEGAWCDGWCRDCQGANRIEVRLSRGRLLASGVVAIMFDNRLSVCDNGGYVYLFYHMPYLASGMQAQSRLRSFTRSALVHD
jgi:hypothetical protein